MAAESLKEYEAFTSWLLSLADIPNHMWLTPIADGKWSVGEMVAHFMVWDKFIENERLPLFYGENISGQKADVEEMNSKASHYARCAASQLEVIEKTAETRKRVGKKLSELPEHCWSKSYFINGRQLILSKYIEDMTKHDQHHRQQVENWMVDNRLKDHVNSYVNHLSGPDSF